MSQIVAVNGQKVNLRDISKKDRVWDIHKAKADVVAKMYEIYADNPRDKARSSVESKILYQYARTISQT